MESKPDAVLAQRLREAEHKLGLLARRLIEVQETERRRIARELHDDVGQALTAAKLTLQAIQRARSRSTMQGLVREGLSLLDHCIGRVRSLSLDMRPSLLDDLGLAAALRWYLDRQAERAGFIAEVRDELAGTRLPPDVETTCFRIVQEAVTNVVRHASAHRVTVHVSASDGLFHVSVRDDGVGFDVAAARARGTMGESFGLLGMEERATLAGGRLRLESRPGSGTIVRAELPVEIRESGEEAVSVA